MVKIQRTGNYDNGVEAVDMLMIRRNLLGIGAALRNEQLLAGDVSAGGDIDAVDLLLIRRMLLGISQTFPGGYSWHFYPESTIQNPNSPFDFSVTFSSATFNFNFKGVKIGDLDGSADPGF